MICIDTHGSAGASAVVLSCNRCNGSSVSESPRLITVRDKDRPDHAFSRIFMHEKEDFFLSPPEGGLDLVTNRQGSI
jgi:hypothetical protein